MKSEEITRDGYHPSDTSRLLLAVSFPLLALVLQWIFWEAIQPYAWLLFYPAVFFSAWVGGKKAGILVTIFSTLVAWWVFIPLSYSFILERPASAVAIGIFVGMGVLVSQTHERLRKANQLALEALATVNVDRDQLEERVSERTAELEALTIELKSEITERKQKDELLASSNKLLQEVTDNSPALIYIIDTAGIFQLINRKFGEVFGVPAATLVGKSRESFMLPDIAAQHFANDQQVIASRQPITFEEENEESDGKHTYLSIKFPLYDLQGSVSGICGISTDITGRKQDEERIYEQLQELQRWQSVMLDREDRVIELKIEVNDLLADNGLPPRYPSAAC